MSLQVRLTLLFLILGAPVLSIFGAAVFFISRDRLYAGVDDALVSEAETVIAALSRDDGPLTRADVDSSRRGLERLALEGGGAFVVLDPELRPLYASNGEVSALVNLSEGTSSRAFSTNVVDGDRVRILTLPVYSIGRLIGYVQTAETLDLVDSSLSRIRRVLIAGVFVVLLVTGLPAYWLAGRAIDPVRRVSRLARELEETADFSRRLGPSSTSGEMQELTDTFNRMVARVEKMMQAQRAFLADSSHELRRPLTLLRTNIDVINDPALSEAERQEIETEMRLEAEAMSRLVTDLGLLSRDGHVAFVFSEVDVGRLCTRCLEEARLAFPSHRFEAAIAPEVTASVDNDRFGQAVANLLQNAAAYSLEGGVITLSLQRNGDLAEIEVRDQGCGMSEADVAHAFDRFYRGTSAHANRTDGFGLGLAIVRHVIESHGGQVAISSRVGVGTRVMIRIPALSPASLPRA